MHATEEQIALMKERFIHRDDAFAKQKYEAGKGTSFRRVYDGFCKHEPRHMPSYCPDVTTIPVQDFHILQHVRGDWTLGVYQLDLDSTVKWLCLDVDATGGYDYNSFEGLQEATRSIVHKVNDLFGNGYALVENSGSKGYHVWLFFETPVSAEDAYKLGHLISDNLNLAKGVNIEVYPKQTTLGEFGNLVKLPLGVHLKTDQRCFFLNGNFEPKKDQWKALAEVNILDAETVRKAVRHVKDVSFTVTERISEEGIPCLTRLMEEGAVEGTRDTMMFYLASMCRKRGFPSDIALAVAEAVNEKSQPPMDPANVAQKVSSAYDSMYSMFPCKTPHADSYCSSTCVFWTNKVADRWKGDPVQAVGKISRD